ncbi:hypothetical protein [Anaerococcus sp. AGMB09787]|uniref:hypothetical protein n=1 Tax=Anaerococcus sp. AGMB09787 TaxID=2922869 RepID=UPI001FAF8B71|nr:hypothetical protein [Anaerococcus sp. AGMB09787]
MKLSKNKYYYLALCFISLYSLFNIFVAFSFGEILNLVKTSNYDKFLAIILKALLVILLLAISFYYKEKFKRKYLAGEVYNLSNRVFTSTILSRSEQNSGKVISPTYKRYCPISHIKDKSDLCSGRKYNPTHLCHPSPT